MTNIRASHCALTNACYSRMLVVVAAQSGYNFEQLASARGGGGCGGYLIWDCHG